MTGKQLLELNWIQFNQNIMDVKLNELKKALDMEVKGKKRGTFIARLRSRISQLARNEVLTKLKG